MSRRFNNVVVIPSLELAHSCNFQHSVSRQGLLVIKAPHQRPFLWVESTGQSYQPTEMAGLRGNRGFTLIELLIVITIVAILMAIGIPSYQTVITSNNISSEVNALAFDMNHARSEAIKNGTPVSVCASDTSGAGPYTCSTSLSWSGGWITLASTPANTVLRVQQPLITTDIVASTSTSALSTVSFNYFGFSTIKGSITVSPLRGTVSPQSVCISAVGNIQVVRGGDTQCP